MIYDATNCQPGCSVYDVDTKERIDQVVAINVKAGWVQVAEQPLRVTAHDQIATRRIRFASIYPIKGREHWPVLFHCYGRKDGIEVKPDGSWSPPIHGDGSGVALPAIA